MKFTLLEPGKYYHIYNRAKNGDPLFENEEAFRFFMKLYKSHIAPIAETYAYCLLHDHLHLLIRIKDDAEGSLFKPFAILFNSYTSGYNRHNGKEGRIFKFKLKRIEIRSLPNFREMIRYVNQNPWRHGVTDHPGSYRFSSFRSTITNGPTIIAKDKIMRQFGSSENLEASLLNQVDESKIKLLLLEE
ncbi:MAG: transposase [Bacteroidetes bacterium]|nr:transposase [Bacteroidota bacterium]